MKLYQAHKSFVPFELNPLDDGSFYGKTSKYKITTQELNHWKFPLEQKNSLIQINGLLTATYYIGSTRSKCVYTVFVFSDFIWDPDELEQYFLHRNHFWNLIYPLFTF